MTVRENLDLGAYRRGRGRREPNRDRVFGIFPRLATRQSQSAGTLSGGEQQMLAIGRGLMAEPQLLILDEPSLGLSPLLVEELFALIKSIAAQGIALLLVEQNTSRNRSTLRSAATFWTTATSFWKAAPKRSETIRISSALISGCRK